MPPARRVNAKARLIYITKPSLLIDVISAFVSVLGVDEFLHTDVPIPQKTGEIQPQFSIFHAGTSCWEMVADDDGRKRNKDHQVATPLKEGRYRVRPDGFLQKIQWLRAIAARKLHEQINISAVSRLLDNRYTFVSIDTLRNPDNPLPNIFAKIEESSVVPLVIVDEYHGLGRKTQRRQAVADLVWGPAKHNGKPPILRIPGALVVGRLHAKKQGSGRGKYQSWVISHDELRRDQREGLLPQGRSRPAR